MGVLSLSRSRQQCQRVGIQVELCPNVSCRFARCTRRSWKEYFRRPNTLRVSVGSILITSPPNAIAIPEYILRPIASRSVRYITLDP